jgi:hypothetical protein
MLLCTSRCAPLVVDDGSTIPGPPVSYTTFLLPSTHTGEKNKSRDSIAVWWSLPQLRGAALAHGKQQNGLDQERQRDTVSDLV